VKEFMPYMNDTVEAMGIIKVKEIRAPISRNYI